MKIIQNTIYDWFWDTFFTWQLTNRFSWGILNINNNILLFIWYFQWYFSFWMYFLTKWNFSQLPKLSTAHKKVLRLFYGTHLLSVSVLKLHLKLPNVFKTNFWRECLPSIRVFYFKIKSEAKSLFAFIKLKVYTLLWGTLYIFFFSTVISDLFSVCIINDVAFTIHIQSFSFNFNMCNLMIYRLYIYLWISKAITRSYS